MMLWFSSTRSCLFGIRWQCTELFFSCWAFCLTCSLLWTWRLLLAPRWAGVVRLALGTAPLFRRKETAIAWPLQCLPRPYRSPPPCFPATPASRKVWSVTQLYSSIGDFIIKDCCKKQFFHKHKIKVCTSCLCWCPGNSQQIWRPLDLWSSESSARYKVEGPSRALYPLKKSLKGPRPRQRS